MSSDSYYCFSRYALALVALVLATVLLVLTRGWQGPSYRGTTYLEWNELVACSPAGVPSELQGREGSVGTFAARSSDTHGICESKPFALRAEQFEIALAGLTLPERYIRKNAILFFQENNQPAPVSFVSSRELGGWTFLRLRFQTERAITNGDVYLKLVGDDTRKGWIGVRNNVVFLEPVSPTGWFFNLPSQRLSFAAWSLAIGLLLAIASSVLLQSSPRSVWFLFYLFVAVVVHGRGELYFHWDEWHVLERFMLRGLPGVIYTHNEHFLPLFFSYLFAQRFLFGDVYYLYLLCGAVVHATNALLLNVLMERLLSDGKVSATSARRSAALLGFLFAASALHAEVLQWAFEQSVMLSTLALLVGLLALESYWRAPSIGKLLLFSLMALASPLFFGNGFAYFGYALCLVILLLGHQRVAVGTARRLFVLASVALFAEGLAAIGYVLNPSTAGHGVGQISPFLNLPQLLAYLFVGAEFGTGLRGMGLFPSLELGAATELLGPSGLISPELVGAFGGIAFSCVVLAFSTLALRFKPALRLFLVGHLWLLGSMVLPSLARWQLGLSQALSLRYCYAAFPGLLFILAGFTLWFVDARRRTTQAIGVLMLGCFLASQLFSSTTFRYFVDRGAENRQYAAELMDWKARMNVLHAENYEGQGTPLFGSFPLMPGGLTPGKHPDEIYRVLQYLRAVPQAPLDSAS